MKQLSIADLEVNELGQSTSSTIDVKARGHCAARAAGANDKPKAAPMRAGCPRWSYDFKKSCGKCKVTGELNPDGMTDNLFRCDFEYTDCKNYKSASGELAT